jgi:Tol biopolymer transport system component
VPVVHGQYLLYLTSVSGPSDSYTPQAWLVKPNGTGARKIADGFSLGPYSPPPVDLDAIWSHDGSMIHIIRWPSCAAHISNLPVSASTEIPVVTMTIKDWLFTWSPTDGKIAYWHYSGADQVCEQNSVDNIHDLAWMNAAGGTQTIVKANVNYRLSAWLPNGSGLVAVNDYNAWYRVSLLDGSAISLGVTATRLDVSPDGKEVAFLNGGYLYVRNLAGGASKNLGAATDFAWRPDSAALAVSGGKLRLVNATTGNGTVVFAFATKSPSWSPGGSKLAFIKSSGGGVFVVAANGGPVTTIPGTTKATHVYWQP